MALKFMECQLCFNQESVYQILSDCLGRSNFCLEFVLHSLRDEQKEPKVTDCEDFIQTMYQTSPFITVDIFRVFKYNYKTMSAHGVEDRSITEAQTFLLVHKLIQMMMTFMDKRVFSIKNSSPEEKL